VVLLILVNIGKFESFETIDSNGGR